ncbi:Npl6p TDEL_0A02470 [Torulaspora delbrueckii]|uniref:Chromatin structure-remodeling complex subunit RSC7 n=1 Tax=Torulaspora delbrueckii TaxID=4950 RepID=G8ZLT5_TORDE|nr:hypothetical protein TDEL_0A02470 [Torulaspora delbrueckii]CCE89579.1 hypothetical protein TDEL_0A02470 [Torulaspora delbrueckii]
MSEGLEGSPELDARESGHSRSGSERPNYQIDTEGLDLKEEEDDGDEYHEEDELEEEEEEEEEGNQRETVTRGTNEIPKIARRGRPSKRKNREMSQDDNRSETDESRSGSTVPGFMNLKRPRLSYPVDESGAPLPIVNEEYDLPDDPEGETKITKDGDLLGGRQFLVRSFTVSDKGKRKFMLSTEPARAVGFRDSYLFFQYHPNLYKFILSQEQKNDLIDRGVLPYSYRSRQIALVTARSVFKEFGAKIIIGGKNITDDYYSTKLRQEGRVIEGSYAREPLKKNGTRAYEGIEYSVQSVNPAKNAVEFFDRRNPNYINGATATASASKISATNWLYQHAAACSRFNSDMYYDRVRILLIENQGLRDPYTNTLHIPQSTQSSKVLRRNRKPLTETDIRNDCAVLYETKISDPDLTRNKTGLSEVPLDIFDDLVSEEIKTAIIEQQNFEKGIRPQEPKADATPDK